MKSQIHKLRIGDLLWATIEEVITANEYIVSFQGDLVRVKNQTQKVFQSSEKMLVRVIAIDPLEFQMVSEPYKKNLGRIDVNA
jgi:hypothetical protein